MRDKKREIPVPDPNAGGLEYVCPSASWGDMTGLIPSPAETAGEREAYADVYPYMPEPEVKRPEI